MIVRFLAYMPSSTSFVVYGILLRVTEGVGWAMTNTTTFTLIPVLFPSRVGTLTVSITYIEWNHPWFSTPETGTDIWSNWTGVYCWPSTWQHTCCCKMQPNTYHVFVAPFWICDTVGCWVQCSILDRRGNYSLPCSSNIPATKRNKLELYLVFKCYYTHLCRFFFQGPSISDCHKAS